jgi:molybdenum storage protein
VTPNRFGAQHVQSRFMRESLIDKKLLAGTESSVTSILPDVNVIQIGGRSIMDRGRSALLPLLDEIVANQAEHRLIIGVGGGVRSRHIFSVGLDLGLPTGVLATLSAKDAAQNAYMVSCLLAKHGFVYLEAPFVVQLLPAMLAHGAGLMVLGSTRGRLQRDSALRIVGASSGAWQAAAARQRRGLLSGCRGVRSAQYDFP